MSTTLRERIALMEELPTLPHVGAYLRHAIDNQRTSLKGMAAIVAGDPALAAQVLALLYSRHPEFKGQLPQVSRAVAVLGFNSMRGIATTRGTTTGPAARASVEEDDECLNAMWAHAVGVAVAARVVAEHVGGLDAEACQTAGLLHDIGKIALYHLERNLFATLAGNAHASGRTFYQCEVADSPVSHAVVGRLLADRWGFPIRLTEAIGWHHTPQLATGTGRFVAAIHLADVIAHALGLGWSGDIQVPPLHASVPSKLGLRPPQVADIMSAVEEQYPRKVAVLGLASADLYGGGVHLIPPVESIEEVAS